MKKNPVMNWNEQETVDKKNTIHEMMYVEYFSVQQILKYSQVNKRVKLICVVHKKKNEMSTKIPAWLKYKDQLYEREFHALM